jgi:2-dehydro-3-deoxygluconokinase
LPLVQLQKGYSQRLLVLAFSFVNLISEYNSISGTIVNMGNKILTFGELMIRLSPPSFQRFVQANQFEINYGGSEANVIVSLAQLGMSTRYLTRLPDNELAQTAIQNLRKFNIDTSYISSGGERMGIYFLERGAMARASKVIYDRKYSSVTEISKDMFDWNKVMEDVSWLHCSGVTPAISKSAAQFSADVIRIAKERKITISVDINFRKNLWQYGSEAREVMPKLLENADIIIGGKDDTEKVLGISGVDLKDTEAVCAAWMKKFPACKLVVLTERDSVSASHNKYCAKLWNGKELFSSYTSELTHIVDRVGTGDAFTAGLIYGLIHNKEDYQKTLNFAVAAATLKHTIAGDFNICTKEEIEKLMNGDSSGKVNR